VPQTIRTTHVLVVTDMSGSMAPLAEDVRGGFNTYIDGLRADGDEYRVTVALFNDQYELICIDAPLRAVPRLDAMNYRPRGLTALLDALGRTVHSFETRVPELGEDDRVILVVATDGEDNQSARFTWAHIADLIRDRERGGKWTCLYLGAHADAWNQASRMGFTHGSTVSVSHDAGGTQASYTGLTRATTTYSKGASADETSGILRTAVDQTAPTE
jgi:hypothetical protein